MMTFLTLFLSLFVVVHGSIIEETRSSFDSSPLASFVSGLAKGKVDRETARVGNSDVPLHIGDSCSSNDDCAHIHDSSCADSESCQCDAGFVPLSNIACIPEANFIGDACAISAQCVNLDSDTVCYKDRCLCEPHYYIAALQCPPETRSDPFDSTGQFVVGLGTAADETASTTTSIICHRKGTLGDSCCQTKQCSYKVWASECRNALCQCLEGFVAIGAHTCARKAKALGDPCAVDSQCQDLAGSVCNADGFCWCNAKSTPSTPIVIGRQGVAPVCLSLVRLGESCTVDSQCTAPKSRCTDSVCVCEDGYVTVTELNVCLILIGKESDNIGGCLLSLQCKAANTVCSPDTGKCECATGFSVDMTTGECEEIPSLAFSAAHYVYGNQFCCRPEDHVYGYVSIDTQSTDTTATYSDDSPDFSVDSSGAITLDAGKVLASGTAVFTVTATSTTDSSLKATTTVELRPTAACCLAAVSVVTVDPVMSIIVILGDSNASGTGTGCAGVDDSDAALNADNIVDLTAQTTRNADGITTTQLSLFQPTCGPMSTEVFLFSDVSFTAGASRCRFDESSGTLDWTGSNAETADVDTIDRQCRFSAMVSGCSQAPGSRFYFFFEVANKFDC